MKYKAAIFDMDGTIVDSGPAWRTILQTFPQSLGMDISDNDFEQLYTLNWDDTIAYFRKKYDEAPLVISFELFIEDIRIAVADVYRRKVVCKKGADDYVRALHAQGVRMCVATLTPTEYAKIALERINLAQYFEFILTGDDVGADKSVPTLFLEACSKLGATPSNTVVYEDSLTAARTAHAAGFDVIAVFDPHQTYDFPEILPYAVASITDYTRIDQLKAHLAEPAEA